MFLSQCSFPCKTTVGCRMETPGILNPKPSLSEKGKYHSHTLNVTAALIYRFKLIFCFEVLLPLTPLQTPEVMSLLTIEAHAVMENLLTLWCSLICDNYSKYS